VIGKSVSCLVGLWYLSVVAFTFQNCFAPNKTPGFFKITSAGPDGLGGGKGRGVWGVETMVRL